MLVTPPYHCGVVESAGRWPNLAFIYIAGELEEAGFEVEIYDAMSRFHDYDEIRAHIRKAQPDFIGVTAITATINDAIKVLRVAREECPEITTFLGGVHPTFCYEDILTLNNKTVDYCVLGEGEVTTPLLLEADRKGEDVSRIAGIAFYRNGRAHRTAQRRFIPDLDQLRPAWHLVDWSDYPLYFIDNSTVAIVSSSRGCLHACSFCSQHKFWHGSYRVRSAFWSAWRPLKRSEDISPFGYRVYAMESFAQGETSGYWVAPGRFTSNPWPWKARQALS